VYQTSRLGITLDVATAGEVHPTGGRISNIQNPVQDWLQEPEATGRSEIGGRLLFRLLQERHAVDHPVGRGLVLEVMVVELLDANQKILLVLDIPQSMDFAGIRQENHVFPVEAQRVAELEPLQSVNRPVIRALHQQQRRVHRPGVEDRRLVDKQLQVVVRIRAEPALAINVANQGHSPTFAYSPTAPVNLALPNR